MIFIMPAKTPHTSKKTEYVDGQLVNWVQKKPPKTKTTTTIKRKAVDK